MDKKYTGISIMIIGAAIAIISLIADFIGLGNDPSVIGWKQLIGAGVGLVIVAVGLWLALKKNGKAS